MKERITSFPKPHINCGIKKLEPTNDGYIASKPSNDEIITKVNEIIELLNTMARSGNGLY